MTHHFDDKILRGICALFIGLCIGMQAVHAQQIVAITHATTAGQEVASSAIECIHAPSAQLLPAPRMDGGPYLFRHAPVPLGPTSDYPLWLLLAGETMPTVPGLDPEARLFALKSSPFQVLPLRLPPGLEARGVTLADGRMLSEDRAIAAFLLEDTDDVTHELAVAFLSLRPQPSLEAPHFRQALPGNPVDALMLGERLHILCANGIGASIETIAPGASPPVLHSVELSIPPGSTDIEPRALVQSAAPSVLFLVFCGYASGAAGDAAPASWIGALNTQDLSQLAAPVQFSGHAARNAIASTDSGCWIATRTPGSHFASLGFVRMRNGALEKELESSLGNVSRELAVAAAPTGDSIAVARDASVQRWSDASAGPVLHEAGDPVTTLSWTESGIFAGAAGMLTRLDPESGDTLSAWQLHSGRLAHTVVLPAVANGDADGDGLDAVRERAQRTRPDLADTDADGLHDGIDPAPRAPTQQLMVSPPSLFFRGAAAGSELRALRVTPVPPGAAWSILADPQAVPWLRMQPRSGSGPGVVYLGIDPYVFSGETVASGEFSIQLHTSPAANASPPHQIPVRVGPVPPPLTRILWVWLDTPEPARAEGDPHGVKPLADLLARPPHFFAHEDAGSPVLRPLHDYALVVLPASAAARGAIPRQTALDYISNGGALLLYTDQLEDFPAIPVESWLAPFGLTLSPDVQAAAGISSGDAHLGKLWAALAHPARQAFTLQGIEGSHSLVLRSRGYGRAAFLGVDTPLKSGTGEDNAFAVALFRWLADAGQSFEDLDGDRLPDALEDLNRSASFDAGETDFLNPDTDGDGISDGLEDVNRNGLPDEGETDPRNPDTDGDGIWDGADATPTPRFGAPYIIRVEPSESPAEGGLPVIISGRNLAPGSRVFFGDIPAPWARVLGSDELLTSVPDAGDRAPGTVPIRVISPRNDEATALLDAFRYLPRTQMRILLRPGGGPWERGEYWDGILEVHLRLPKDTRLARLAFTVTADGPVPVEWGSARPGAALATDGQELDSRLVAEGLFVTYQPNPDTPRTGPIMQIPWQVRRAGNTGEFNIRVSGMSAWSEADAQISVSAESLPIALPTP